MAFRASLPRASEHHFLPEAASLQILMPPTPALQKSESVTKKTQISMVQYGEGLS